MAVEQVARWPWNAWPDESGLGGRMAWNPQDDDQQAELRKLRAELKRVTEERDILKKAAAYFAKECG